MTDDRFEELLSDLRDEYHAPPSAPREQMWERIEAARAAKRARRPRRAMSPKLWWPVAAAALLIVGVGIGFSLRPKHASDVVREDMNSTQPDMPRFDPYAILAAQHLDSAEALLTHFESGAAPQVSRAQLATWARQLLDDTRLLLDSPAVDQPTMRALLADVELLLALVVQADQNDDPRDIAAGLRSSGLLERLRARIPAETI